MVFHLSFSNMRKETSILVSTSLMLEAWWFTSVCLQLTLKIPTAARNEWMVWSMCYSERCECCDVPQWALLLVSMYTMRLGCNEVFRPARMNRHFYACRWVVLPWRRLGSVRRWKVCYQKMEDGILGKSERELLCKLIKALVGLYYSWATVSEKRFRYVPA